MGAELTYIKQASLLIMDHPPPKPYEGLALAYFGNFRNYDLPILVLTLIEPIYYQIYTSIF